VEYLDYELGLFFNWLKKQGLYDHSLIIMMADHGESLGEHDEDTHGFFIYRPTVWIPLIVHAPFQFPQHKINGIVESIDVAPTILEALGIPKPGSFQGQSLLNLMFGDKEIRKEVAYTETYYPRMHYGWSELKALYYNKNWKYIQAPKQELYDLEEDPDEKENLALKESEQARRARNRLQEFMTDKSQNARKVGEALKLDKEDLQKLAALGYFTNTVDTKGKTDLPDPKGKVKVFNDLADSRRLMQEKKYDQAIEILELIIKDNPQIVDGILQLGNAYNENNMPKKALDCFYRVLEQKPDYQAAMINVVNSLIRLGDLDKGIEEIQRFFKTFPRDHALYNELATIYFLKQDYDKSLAALNKSLEIEQINPSAYNRLGEIYVIKKDYQTAETFLNKAKEINPTLQKLFYNLAQVEEARGNLDKATEYYKIELENSPEAFKAAYNAAENLRKAGKYDEALDYYRKSMEGNPQFNIPYFMIAKYYLDQHTKIDEAIQLCEKGIELKPFNKYTAFGYYILSDIYSFKGDQVKSNSYFSKGEDVKRTLIKENRWE
jgi:tetratricopeptide (TPR) repeat protein